VTIIINHSSNIFIRVTPSPSFSIQVLADSKAKQLGIEPGDVILSTSATAGDNMWNHNAAEGVKSALSTRFVIYSTVKMQLERPLSRIPESVRAKLMVPYVSIVRVSLFTI
jgi:hypothetical protein